MLRRFATFCVLLLGLSVVIPTAVACAFQTQRADCCPMGGPCETQGGPTVVAADGPSCCTVQPAPTRSTVTLNMQSDRRIADSPTPDCAVPPAFEFPGSFFSPYAGKDIAAAAPHKINQQQIYLHTARLRL